MGERDNYSPDFIEQLLVSGAVIRQGDKLPPELVEYHLNLLQEMGLVAEAVANIPKEDLLALLDKVQKNLY